MRFAINNYDSRGARAEKQGSGWRLSGEKVQVEGGNGADVYLVSARTAGAETDADCARFEGEGRPGARRGEDALEDPG